MSGKTAGIGLAALAAVVGTAWLLLERPRRPGAGDAPAAPGRASQPAAVALTGSVRATDGTSLAGRTLWIQAAAGVGGAGATPAVVTATVGPDGAFRVAGLPPGRYQVGVRSTPELDEANPPFLLASGEPIVLEAEAERRADLVVAPCGILRVMPTDPRLPGAPGDATRTSTAEQRAFGERCRVDVRRSDGHVVAEQRGIYHHSCGTLTGLALLPGAYVVHAEFPGDAPREVAVAIEPRRTAEVSLAR